MKLNLGKLAKTVLKVAAPVIIAVAATKATAVIEKEADKLKRKVDRP